MYELYPCDEWRRFKTLRRPLPKQNADGSFVYEQYTRPGRLRDRLLDFKILPDKASSIVTTAIVLYLYANISRFPPRKAGGILNSFVEWTHASDSVTFSCAWSFAKTG